MTTMDDHREWRDAISTYTGPFWADGYEPDHGSEAHMEDSEDMDYADAVDDEGPPAERITERDITPLDHDPRESLDERITA